MHPQRPFVEKAVDKGAAGDRRNRKDQAAQAVRRNCAEKLPPECPFRPVDAGTVLGKHQDTRRRNHLRPARDGSDAEGAGQRRFARSPARRSIGTLGEYAWICISRCGNEVALHRAYCPNRFGEYERLNRVLEQADWRRLQDVLEAAGFWALPRHVHQQGRTVDGYDILIEARRATCSNGRG